MRSGECIHETTGYVSYGSSSDESLIGVVPNLRPLTTPASCPSVKKENTSAVATPSSSGDGDSSDDALESLTSDLQPTLNQAAAQTISAEVSLATPATGPSSSARKEKRTMSATRRQWQSRTMKERWANGGMDGVHMKIKETMKRRASLKDVADGVEERPPKRTASTVDRAAPKPAVLAALPDDYGTGSTPAQLYKWEYIRPYLNNFKDKTIPHRFWIPELLALPRARDLEFNPHGRSSGRPFPFADSDEKKVAALLLHITGQEALQPCSRCMNGNGVFDGCIKLSPNALVAANIRNCSNCWYARQRCSYETSHREQHAGASEQGHVVIQGDPVLEESESETVEEVSKSGRPIPVRAAVVRPRPPSILLASSGRPYCKWPDASGNLVTLKGNVLLPDGYKVHAGARVPNACPVYPCGRQLADLSGLASHFQRIHFGQLLNDNLDGTFSIVGVYDDRKLGKGGALPLGPPSFPIVVSQNRKAPQTPELHRHTAGAPVIPDQHQMGDNGSNGEEAVNQSMLDSGRQEQAMVMLDYIKPHVQQAMAIPIQGWVRKLLPLPRVRDLRWNLDRTVYFKDTYPRDISCMIIQVTGEEAPKPCTKCAKGEGQFASCVVISRDAPPEVRARMVSCANCSYHNSQPDCSLIDWIVNRPQAPWPGYRGMGGQPAHWSSASAHGPPAADRARPAASDLHQAERLPTDDLDSDGPDCGGGVTEAAARRHTSGPVHDRIMRKITRRPPSAERSDVQSTRQPTAVLSVQHGADKMLELQAWELAPGRILDATSEAPEIIALSRAYLSSGKSQLHSDLEVHNEVITSGTKLSLTPMANRIRSCFVGSGSLKVKVGHNPEFTVSHGSSFTIPAGQSGWVQNRLCVEALMHVSTMTVYD